MLYAILENGGKQYKAEEGSHIELDLLPLEIGKKKTFENVLLLVDGENVKIGTPFIQGVTVDTTVVDHFKAPKITVFKYRAKQRYRVKTGHRQQYSRVVVNSIAFPGKKKSEVESKKDDGGDVKKTTTRKRMSTKPAAKQSKSEKPKTAKPAEAKKKQPAKKEPKKEAPSTRKSIKSLELGARTFQALTDAGIKTVSQLINKLDEGNDSLLEISGIGEKSLQEIKKNLKKFGYK